jgi:hypothetical protein
MEGLGVREIRLPAPRALIVMITALFANPVLMAFAGVGFVRLAELAVCWGLLMVALTWGGRRVVSDRGVRVAWRMIEWRDIATATLRLGFIEFRDERRGLSVPDNRVTREAILMCAPPGHVVRAALAQRPPPRVNPLDALAALFAAGVLVAALVGCRLWLKNHRRVAEIDQAYAADFGKFERDVRLASTIDLFRPPFDGLDAAPFLNPRVHWCPDTGPSSTSGVFPVQRLPAPCRQRFDDACISAALQGHPDLSWMRELRQYAYWDLFATGPAQASLSKQAPGDLTEYLDDPHPEWTELVLVVHERLALASNSVDDFPTAIVETRQLARLAYSTETFVGAGAALAMISAETRIREKLGRLAPEDGVPAAVPGQTLKAARRALIAAQAFFCPLAPPAERSTVFGDPQLFFARCQGLAGGTRASLIVRDVLETRLIFARDYRPDYAAMGAIIEASRGECRLRDQRRQWALSSTSRKGLNPVVRLLGESLTSPDVSLEPAYGR